MSRLLVPFAQRRSRKMATMIQVRQKSHLKHFTDQSYESVKQAIEVTTSCWMDDTLFLEIDGVPSTIEILLYCLGEASKVSKSSPVGKECSYYFHESEEILDKNLRRITYTQSVVSVRGTMFEIDGSFLAITQDSEEGTTSVRSSLVPTKASIDIPSEEWLMKAVKDKVLDEIWVGPDPRIRDRLRFRIVFQKPVYSNGERVGFMDSKGEILGNGRTNDFAGSVCDI